MGFLEGQTHLKIEEWLKIDQRQGWFWKKLEEPDLIIPKMDENFWRSSLQFVLLLLLCVCLINLQPRQDSENYSNLDSKSAENCIEKHEN